MNIRKANAEDAESVALLHNVSIAGGFLSMLGTVFLKRLYGAISMQPESAVFIAESEGRIIGFIAGTTATRRLYMWVIAHCWHRLLPGLCKYMLRGTMFRRILETTLYGFISRNIRRGESPEAELLSVAVDATRRGEGVGRLLVETLEDHFRKQQVCQYKVVTFSMDEQSNAFYRSCSFMLNRTFIHHGNVMNEYIKWLT